jgi:hypothetical protein
MFFAQPREARTKQFLSKILGSGIKKVGTDWVGNENLSY